MRVVQRIPLLAVSKGLIVAPHLNLVHLHVDKTMVSIISELMAAIHLQRYFFFFPDMKLVLSISLRPRGDSIHSFSSQGLLQFSSNGNCLRRGDGALLQRNVINQGRSRFDQTFSILEANSFITKGLRRGNNCLDFLSDDHV